MTRRGPEFRAERAPRAGHLPADARFLAPLAERARRGDVLVRRDPDGRAPAMPTDGGRRSAVLIHVAGTGIDDAQLVLEERGHRLRSQPGQFSLPGGRRDPGDRDDVHTALREAQEETGLDPSEAHVLGAFAPIPMPWRGQRVTPVLSWSPVVPVLGVQDPVEVERVVWAPLTGEGSLTDPSLRRHGRLRGLEVGPVFELPEDAFVWGFTAMILEKVLTGLGLEGVPRDAGIREIPPERRR
ncbi:NUDIX hydrolase [Brachybacterium aquaticum]|uniref:8-oxo-dGTP pyrophosphatase MutT (NUDIX family) n=1 Tax=Brachybacterium aquaticum TaxID=1432564 RepID=A0A841A9W8_9MICO|nr:CoA pyrophosphatase [Brachybacterium aquaticum]MBB5830401.1 8-oxo-dGTP pyrophosphatase MutT (NUDIX family) [Brachybacterium aquaticum]